MELVIIGGAFAVLALFVVVANRFHARFYAPSESPGVEPPREVPPPQTSVDPDALEAVRALVAKKCREGYLADDEIVQWVSEMADDEYPDADVADFIVETLDEERAKQREEQRHWPAQTDCDRLDAAFIRLNDQGIVARQDFSCCQNCGHGEIVNLMLDERERRPAHGYAFFHMQDTESAVDGLGLCLAYGDETSDRESQEAIGHEIVAALRDAGLSPVWSGSVSERIRVPMTWQRRRS